MSNKEVFYQVFIDNEKEPSATIYEKSLVSSFIDTCFNENIIKQTVTITNIGKPVITLSDDFITKNN